MRIIGVKSALVKHPSYFEELVSTMDPKLVYVKTPTGDEAIRQSTHIVKRELRMVLLQVDGKVTLGALSVKLGNPAMVEAALTELEKLGLVALSDQAVTIWEHSKIQAAEFPASASSRFSGFVPKTAQAFETLGSMNGASRFSSFPPQVSASMPKGDPASEDVLEELPKPGRSMISRGLSLLLVLCLLLAGALIAFPHDRFKPDIEAAAGRLLQDTVVIDKLGLSFLPRPRLLLSGVKVGHLGEFNIDEVRLDSPLALLFQASQSLPGVELSGVQISANKLGALPIFLASAGAGVPKLGRLHVERLTVSARDMALGDLSGDVFFREDGLVEKATFQTLDRSISLDAMPTSAGLSLKIDGAVVKVPGTAFGFESLHAKAVLNKNRLLIQELDGFALGGTLTGSGWLDWSKGLSMTADTAFRLLDSRRVTAVFAPSLKLEGDFGGSAKLRSAGLDWDALLGNIEATLDVDIARGLLHGVDLGEASRRAPGSVVRSGASKFDHLQAQMTVGQGKLLARNIRLSAGMMSASGAFSVARDRQVDAELMVVLQTSVSTLNIPLSVRGVLPDLSVINGK